MKTPSRFGLLSWIFALTIFLSAFLLFEVQPILSKYVLPWFGGTPAVWTTCMVFFQTVLFLGYAYAHLSQRVFRPSIQAAVHLVLLVAAIAVLPIAPDASWKPAPDQSPTWRILMLLGVCVGLPYFALSTTGPLVQAWFSRTYPQRSPYRLYALSNIGSLLALLSYPFYVEPAFNIGSQARYWTWGFIAFAVLCAISAAIAGWFARGRDVAERENSREQGGATHEAPPTWGRRLLWLALPALASMMLLATTNHVCQDVAVIPFLWVMPLSLYLLTFIISFDHERWYRRKFFALGAVASLCLVTAVDQLITTGANVSFSFVVELSLYFAALFFLCMVCHGELVRLKPQARYLTSFYLMISAGGALGGLFVSLAAPVLFSTFLEWKIGLIAGCLLAAATFLGSRSAQSLRRLYYLAPALVLSFVGFNYLSRVQSGETELNISSRSFYGVSRVIERDSDDPQQHKFLMYSGRIVHGVQFVDPQKHLQPNAYFGTETGCGRAFTFFGDRPDLRVGVVGLGAGTMASYARPGQNFRFYEINPDMLRLADKYFSYLKDCRGQVEVKLGDGRLSLERETSSADPRFDLLVLDAFSGDSVPAHLLTKEAFEIYLKRLKSDGAIAVNISNRYLNLAPVVCGVARRFGLTPLRFSSPGNAAEGKFPAEWLLLTKNSELIAKYPEAARIAAGVAAVRNGFWTDDHSNLFEILK